MHMKSIHNEYTSVLANFEILPKVNDFTHLMYGMAEYIVNICAKGLP